MVTTAGGPATAYVYPRLDSVVWQSPTPLPPTATIGSPDRVLDPAAPMAFVGTLLGVLVVGVLRNGLTLMGVSSVYQVLITGILVILAVTVDQLSRKAAR